MSGQYRRFLILILLAAVLVGVNLSVTHAADDTEDTSYRKLALMLEYFKGHSPNGQFYQRKIEYLGVGLHYYF